MQCIVLAAGEGRRMHPLTASRPKVMLPLANRPMLEHLVRAAVSAGATEMVIVVGYREEAVRGHFRDGADFGIPIHYVVQRDQRGTADALDAARDRAGETFLLMNGDMILAAGEIRSMMAAAAPAMGITVSEHPESYGTVTVEGEHITSLQEKSPHPRTSLINAGIYRFEREIFDRLRGLAPSPRGELELTDAISGYIAAGTLSARPLASWQDIGNPWDLLAANNTIIAGIEPKKEGEIEDGAVMKGPVAVGAGSRILAGTYIEGPCVIGRDCTIGPHAYIRPATAIGDGCHIGHCSEVKNSIIMEETKVPHRTYIGDSIIGSRCNFGAGTSVANLRHDRAIVKVCGTPTRRVKFGAIIGDDVKFGINCSVNTGTLIGARSAFAPHSLIEGCLGEDTRYGR